MNKKNTIIKIILRLLFLCIPTLAVAVFAIKGINEYYAMLQNKYILQTAYFAVGLFVSCILFSTRLRFLPITVILVAALLITQKVISDSTGKEFDAFFYDISFRIFVFFFISGWICGWGFARLRYFSVFLSVVLIYIAVTLTVSQKEISFEYIARTFLPVLAFAFYIIYMSAAINNVTEFTSAKTKAFLRNFIGVLALFLLVMFVVALIMKPQFNNLEQTWGNKSKESRENGLLERTADSTFKMKQKMKPDPSLDGSDGKKQPLPMFVAYIDSYLDVDGKIPNPFYFTAYHLTNFDTYTETFEKDTIVPYDNLFKPVPSNIKLYFTQTDSAIMKNALRDSLSYVVNSEVYSINLSDEEFVAPATSFFCQPIAIEKDMKSQFKTAYRAKSVVSRLNGAYFVYPAQDDNLIFYQEQRYVPLRNIKNFEQMPEDFMRYYTNVPSGGVFDSIKNLAAEITKGVDLPIDKILAVHNFFFAKDEYGAQIFKYTKNPGIPGIPSASKLGYFLFDSHKGYCAHYAGATTFLLRACGIPTRLTVGFATVDRSDANKGWYWFYEDQAHAWVQCYFPGYGWLDFDNTIGNQDMQESPQPDGTPPMQMQKAYFAGDGKIVFVDTVSKIIDFDLKKMIYHDKEYVFDAPERMRLDVKIAKIIKDSIEISLADLKNGDAALSLSFSEQLRNIKPTPTQSAKTVLSIIPQPMPTDELRLDTEKSEQNKKEEQKNADNTQNKGLSKLAVALISLGIILLLLLAVFAAPYIIYRYYRSKALSNKNHKNKIFYSYKTSMFLLNQLGNERGNATPLQYAHNSIDAKYATNFEKFMLAYLQIKYSKTAPNAETMQFAQAFYPDFEKTIKQNYKLSQRFKKFLNIKRTFYFFVNKINTKND